MLYAGVAETNITPPPDVWLSGYVARAAPAVGVHDELYARALVLDDGKVRLALVAADLIGLDDDLVTTIRAGIAVALDMSVTAIMVHCTHTHSAPCTKSYRDIGKRDETYNTLLCRKLIGVARQAADDLQPAHLTYGEAPAQIGVNRRQTLADGSVALGRNYAGITLPTVQTLCVSSTDGRTIAQLFSHACHPTTLESDNRLISADWCGSAVTHLKARFEREGAETGLAADALPICLQGCCGDIDPLRRGTWEAVTENGRIVADAAHTARWNAHGRMQEGLSAAEITVSLPTQSVVDLSEQNGTGRSSFDKKVRAQTQNAATETVEPNVSVPFTIQRLTLGSVHLLGFPAEMFAAYQQDFSRQSELPVIALSFVNGCVGYLPTAAEHERGGYEVSEAPHYYRTGILTPQCEAIVRAAAYELLGIESIGSPDLSPLPPI